MKLLDWVENAAIENLRLHHKTADVLAKESATTLTVLLAGLGASMAYSMRILDRGTIDIVGIGVTAIAAYLAMLSLILVCRCMMIAPMPAVHNEPANLLCAVDLQLDDIRRFELENIQQRIQDSIARNERVAAALNRIRIAAVVGPFAILILSAAIFSAAGGVVELVGSGSDDGSYPALDHGGPDSAEE